MKRLALLTLLACWIGQAEAALTDGLIARWQLNEGTGTLAEDETGNFDCTIADSWVVDGTRSNVFDSTATNQADCNDTPVANTMSWAFWINADSFPAGNNYVISKYVIAAGARSYRIGVHSDGDIDLQVSSTGDDFDSEVSTTGAKIETTAGWQHVIITFDSGAVVMYIDNTALGSTGNALASIHDSSTDQIIGAANGTVQGFDGQISEVAIWNRVITSEERALVFADDWDDVCVPCLRRRRR